MPVMQPTLRVTIWNEGRHEKSNPAVKKVYPQGIHGVLADMIAADGHSVRTATLDEPEHGLSDDVTNNTDVLLWWGHVAHDEVQDEVVERVYHHIINGMGLIVLHSAHFSKIFRRLMGTSCNLKWREAAENERLWVVQPSHLIAKGMGEYIDIPHEETYGEYFDIPTPDELVLISWFKGGEIFRSGCCYYRGCGKVFYFQPGHETYPTYYQPEVQKLLRNAILWAAPSPGPQITYGHQPESLEKLDR